MGYYINPKLEEFNNSVPFYTQEEAIIIRYAKMMVELVRKLIFVQRNWIPNGLDFKNELFLSVYDISLKVDKSKFPRLSFSFVLRVTFHFTLFLGIAKSELHNRYKDLMAKFTAMRAMAEALKAANP